MKLSNEILFTYGTLRKDADNPMQRFLINRAVWIGKGLFQGKLYFTDGHPAVVSSHSQNDSVVGDLFDIGNSPDLLPKLDRYEGYKSNSLEESLYIRKQRRVYLKENNQEIKAWIYLFNKPVNASEEISSGDYLQFARK